MPEEATQTETTEAPETATEQPAAQPEQAANETLATSAEEASTDSGTAAPAWVTSQLPKDLREEAALHQFKTPGELAKAFLDAEQKAQKGLTRPSDEASAEEWAAYREALGIPEGPDGYQFEVGEGEELDEELTGWFREAAHEAGLSQEQAQRLLEKWNESNSPEAQAEKLKEGREKVEQTLRDEWGKNFDANLNLAFKAMEQFGDEDFRSYLDETGMGNDPRMIKAMSQIGRSMLDDSFVSGKTAERGETEEEVLRRRYPKMYASMDLTGGR